MYFVCCRWEIFDFSTGDIQMREKAYGYTRVVFDLDWALKKISIGPVRRSSAKGGHRTTAEEGADGRTGQYDGAASRCS
jgi:hypothetical protein